MVGCVGRTAVFLSCEQHCILQVASLINTLQLLRAYISDG